MDIHVLSPTPPLFDAVVLYRSRENRLAALTAGPPISSNHRGEQPGTVREHVGIRSDWGQHCGLRLANSAKAIKLGEVIRHTEPDMAIATCFEPVNAPCAILPYCVLRKALERARCLHRGA
ncbi:MAG: Rrf2 family transcriptional regulator [Methyloceanibacter sp.]